MESNFYLYKGNKLLEEKCFFFYLHLLWPYSHYFLVDPIIVQNQDEQITNKNVFMFLGEEAELQYFYGPVGFLIVVNILLFFSTTVYIWKHDWKHGATKRTPRQT